jgi:hypothetical protein
LPQQQDWTMQAAAPHPMTVISLHSPVEPSLLVLYVPEIYCFTEHAGIPKCKCAGSNSTHSVTSWGLSLSSCCAVTPRKTSLLPGTCPANLPCTGHPVT